jgi:RNA polymerase sigma-70 factor (ECF subfamily)
MAHLAAGTAAELDRETELVLRAAGGEREAYDALIQPRLGRLFRMARAIVRDETLARDVVQDTCVTAWRELPSVRDASRFDAWLSQILVNRCRTELRRAGRRSVREIRMDEPRGRGSTGLAAAAHPAPGPSLGDRVVEAEAIRRAFLRLDPDSRALIAMHYVEDRPVAEIAAALRIPAGTVKWRLSRARAALERALEAQR